MRSIALFSLIILATIGSIQGATSKNDTDYFFELAAKGDRCLIQSIFSFIYPYAYLPTNVKELEANCAAQTESFKCLKEMSKKAPALVQRAFLSTAANRGRHKRKFCAEPSGALSRKFLEANKCIMDNKFQEYKANDVRFSNYLLAVKRMNLNDSRVELGHLCCLMVNWRQNFLSMAEPECSEHRDMIEKLLNSIADRSQLDLLCEDDETLEKKICPKVVVPDLPKTFVPMPGNSPSTVGIYLIATLGEAE